MKKIIILLLVLFGFCPLITHAQSDGLPRGAYDVPYKRYESESAAKGGGAVLYSSPEYIMSQMASEASDQKYVGLTSNGSSISWTMTNAGAGVNMRFTLPDAGTTGQTGSLNLYVNNVLVKTINLTSYWAWQYFNMYEHDPSNQGPKALTFMRFDEIHFRLATKLNAGDIVKIQKDTGGLEIGVDFIEVEEVPDPLGKPAGYVSVVDKGAIPNDGIDDQAAFNAAITEADAANTGIYIPEGQFTLAACWRVGASNIGIKGAGMWYTNIHYSTNAFFSGGMMSTGTDLDISDIYFSTNNNIRWENGVYRVYKAFMGEYGANSKMQRLWIEHFECGMWIGDYDQIPLQHTTNLLVSHCRIRNNYADGINFCQGTSNSIIEFCSVRNNGDDGLASWSAKDMGNTVECKNLEFRNNTIENNWRAGSIGIFGGSNHKIHHNYIKDGVAGSGIRFTTEFSGYKFENNTDMRIYENTIISCGTSTDLVNQEKGAIELYDAMGSIQNMAFTNNTIINAQRHGVILGANTINNIKFDNLIIDGTGLDPETKSAFAAPSGGYAIFSYSSSGTTTFNNLVTSRLEEPALVYKGQQGYNIIINSAPAVLVTGVSVTPASSTLAVGGTQQLTPTVAPSNATNKAVTYSSSNNAVATVSASGLITAMASGTATITVTTVDQGKTATCAVTVSIVPVTGVTVSPTSATLAVGGTQQLTSTVAPANATNKTVTYSSNNTGVATVNGSGLVTAVGSGSATITVTTQDGSKTATAAITVNTSYVAVTSVSLNPTSATLAVGGTQQLTPTILPSNATNKAVTYSSNNTGVATVNAAGLVTAVGSGSATITVTTQDGAKTATAAITVNGSNVAVTSVSLSPTSATLAVGGTQQLTPTILPSNATNKAVTYSSNNTGVATVNGSGLVTAISAGSAIIIVTTQDGAKTAAAAITVNTNSSSGFTVNFFRPANWGTAIKIYWWSAMPAGALADASWPGVNMTDAGNGWYSYTFTNITASNLIFNDGTNQTADLNRNKTGWYMNNIWSDTKPGTSIAVTGLTISPTTATLNVGGTQQLTPTVAPSDATNKTVTYSSNNTGVATVNGSGLLTAVSSGSAIITVTTQDGAKTATAAITVNTSSVAVTSVSLSPTSVTLAVGETQQLTPTILPSNASNKSVSYASNNTAVATVNGSGLLTAVSNGTATITVTTADGNKTSTAAITVATATGSYFTIKNKWTNTYLFDAGANVGYGAAVANNNYKWEKVAVDATYFLLKNVATGDVMHIENLTGFVQCTAGSSSWMSAQWLNENVDGTWVRIKNRWQTGTMIHVENQTGSAQYNGGQNNWDSAQWQFQSSTTAKNDVTKTHINSESNSLIGIYPNPAINNEFNILFPELKAGEIATVTVTDINGRKVLVNKLNSSGKINHNLRSGIYVVAISSNTFNVTKKLIVK
jgi:uncharacterized protein YjdB